jgi:transposase
VSNAPVTARFNTDTEAELEALTAAGEPAKAAITAMMCKIVVLLYALLRDHRLPPMPAFLTMPRTGLA